MNGCKYVCKCSNRVDGLYLKSMEEKSKWVRNDKCKTLLPFLIIYLFRFMYLCLLLCTFLRYSWAFFFGERLLLIWNKQSGCDQLKKILWNLKKKIQKFKLEMTVTLALENSNLKRPLRLTLGLKVSQRGFFATPNSINQNFQPISWPILKTSENFENIFSFIKVNG